MSASPPNLNLLNLRWSKERLRAFLLLIFHFRCHGLFVFVRNISEPGQADMKPETSTNSALYPGPEKDFERTSAPAISGETN